MSRNKRKDGSYPIEGSNFIMYSNTPPTGAYDGEYDSGDFSNLENNAENLKDEFSRHEKGFDDYDF